MLDKTLRYVLIKISSSFSLEPSQRLQHSPELDRDVKKQSKIIVDVKPTILWSGNGYHIYLPIQGLILDNFEPFSKRRYPNLFSKYDGKYIGYPVCEFFLLFAIKYLAGGKADPQHRPTFNSCLIRIPNTFNSKCDSPELSHEDSRVRIIQRWNGYPPPIQLLTKEFRRWLVQEEINQKIQNRKMRNTYSIKFDDASNFKIQWIERLLQTGIPDGRKETLRLILGPYVAKRNTYEKSVSKLLNWIEKCEKVKPLDRGFHAKQRIENSLKNIRGFLILNNLRIKYSWLYNVIQPRINIDMV